MLFLLKEEFLTYGYANKEERDDHITEMEVKGYDVYNEYELNHVQIPFTVVYNK